MPVLRRCTRILNLNKKWYVIICFDTFFHFLLPQTHPIGAPQYPPCSFICRFRCSPAITRWHIPDLNNNYSQLTQLLKRTDKVTYLTWRFVHVLMTVKIHWDVFIICSLWLIQLYHSSSIYSGISVYRHLTSNVNSPIRSPLLSPNISVQTAQNTTLSPSNTITSPVLLSHVDDVNSEVSL